MINKYKDWIDMVKACHNALFVAFLAQIANIFYSDGDFQSTLFLYTGAVITFICWALCYKIVSLLLKKGA